jgi:peptidoglycan/xylan/chitin deacetylase (PgdA/CDA1 family)
LQPFVSKTGRAARTRVRRVVLRAVGLPLGLAFARLARLSGRGGAVALVYHRIGDPAGDQRRELLPALGSELFAAQVRHLVSHYRVVAASEALPAAHLRRRGRPLPVAITFDDDLASHLDVAAPILKAAGATATFFVSGASLSRPFRFWWERLQAAFDRKRDLAALGLPFVELKGAIHDVGRRVEKMPPPERDELARKLAELVGPDPEESGMRADVLARLARLDVEIGFHTRRHDVLPLLDDAQLAGAMRDGRSEIEELIGRPLRAISYPHGAADFRVAEAARAAGFDFGFTGAPGAIAPDADPLLLGRVSPSYDSLGELAFDVGWTLFRAALSDKGRATPAHERRPAAT